MSLQPGFRIGASFKVRFAANGTRLVTLGKRITLWDVDARARITTGPSLAHASEVDISPSGSAVIAKNTSGEVLVMDGETLMERARFSGKRFGEGAEIRFAPTANLFVDATWSGRLLVRDLNAGEIKFDESGGSITTLCCTPDRSVWAYGRGGDQTDEVHVRRWPFTDNDPTRITTPDDVNTIAMARMVNASRFLPTRG